MHSSHPHPLHTHTHTYSKHAHALGNELITHWVIGWGLLSPFPLFFFSVPLSLLPLFSSSLLFLSSNGSIMYILWEIKAEGSNNRPICVCVCVCVCVRERERERAYTAGHRAFFPLSFGDSNALMEYQDFFFLLLMRCSEWQPLKTDN